MGVTVHLHQDALLPAVVAEMSSCPGLVPADGCMCTHLAEVGWGNAGWEVTVLLVFVI